MRFLPFRSAARRLAALVILLVLAAPAAWAGGSFETTGSMTTPRTYHGAAKLADGRVLVVAGLADIADLVGTAEVYDPATGRFAATGSLSVPRGQPTTVALADGRVLVAGGRGGNGGDTIFQSAEIWDPATGEFAPTGDMTTPRYVASGTLLDDGKVLIAGGFNFDDGALASAELFDPATGTFTATGDEIQPRVAPANAVRLDDGRVLIVGGTDDDGTLATAEIYDPATGTFAATGSLPEGRLGLSVVTLEDGRVLVVGGSDGNNNYYATAQIYDPAAGTFSASGDLGFPREQQTATRLADGRVLVAGGSHLGGFGSSLVATAEFFDPASGTFSAAGDLVVPRYAAIAEPVSAGRVLIAGGWAGDDKLPTDSAELFVPPEEIFAGGFDGAASTGVVSNYDDLDEGTPGTSFDYNGIHYHDANGIGGVFPDGSTFTAADVGDSFIIEDATVFFDDFPDFGSVPNTLTFGTSWVPGPNLSIGAMVQASMDLDATANAASMQIAYYENGPWAGIEIHLDAFNHGSVVASDMLTIAGGNDRDNPTTTTLSVGGATFDSLKLYATYDGQPTAPRVMVDNLTITPAP